MERLTINRDMVWFKCGSERREPSEMSYHEIDEVLRRLGKYEDTGMEPEDILTGIELANIACMQIRYKKMQELLEQAAEDIENLHGRETALSEHIRAELN